MDQSGYRMFAALQAPVIIPVIPEEDGEEENGDPE